MNVIAKNYVFIGMDKTGSSSLRKLIREVEEATGWERFPKESFFDLPEELKDIPIIGSIRNPLTWYPSYWTWYGEERFRKDWKSDTINASSSFDDWVREYPDTMIREMNRLYTTTARLVRMEHQAQDLIRILEEIKGPLGESTRKLIQNAEIINKNPNPKPSCSPETRAIIIEGVSSIFDKYYPEEKIKNEKNMDHDRQQS